MTTAGAIALGLVLGLLLAQRTSLRARTLVSLAAAVVAVAAVVGLVAGGVAAVTVAIVAPLSYLFRRISMADVLPAHETLQLYGAGAFGVVIGWYVFYINRHRRDDVSLTDLVTLVGVIGGTAVLSLFPAQSDLFGAYGLGLAGGFFLYFLIMVILVATSKNFDRDFFLDGRRKKAVGDYHIPTRAEVAAQQPPPMALEARTDASRPPGV